MTLNLGELDFQLATPLCPTKSAVESYLPQYDTPTLDWCLGIFSGGTCPTDGRNTWLTTLALFCNERGVPEPELLAWALVHGPLQSHGERRITDTIRGNYSRNTANHGTKATSTASLGFAKQAEAVAINDMEWPIPGGLNPTLLPVPAFDEALFPGPLRPALRDVAHRMQCPPDWLAVSWLVMLGAVVGNRCGIRPKQLDTSWLVVPNLWGAIVAEPSQLKTPTLNAALYPLKQLDSEVRKQFADQLREHEADAEVLKARKDALKAQIKKAADKGLEAELTRLRDDLAAWEAITPPTARRYLVNDSTVEKLVELLQDNPRGLLVFRDELMGLLSSWEKQGRESDRQFYLEAWNGTGDYGSDRIGRGSLYVQNCCLSLLGGIQPDKIASYLRQTLHGENDGTMQRFALLTWPDTRPFKYVDERPNQAAQLAAANLLRRLDEFDPIAAGATLLPGDHIPAFQFSPAAQESFVMWLTEWQQQLCSGNDAPALVQHLTKYRKLYPALALLFHLLDVVSGVATPGPVSQTAAELAGRWCIYFEAHARRLYAFGIAGTGASTLGEHLRAGLLKSPFKARDVQRKGWQGLQDQAAVIVALEELMDAGWLREERLPKPSGIGRPTSPSYVLNPRLKVRNT